MIMATIKITDLFNDRVFEIPCYQRGYAWEKSQVRDLFEDIKEAVESNSSHYIGAIVLSKCSDDAKKFYVVDGQQRLTTITLLIAQLLRKVTDEDIKLYQKMHYLKKGERYSLTPLVKDINFFKILIDGDISNLEPQNKSQRFLKDAVEEIRNLIEQLPDPVRFLDAVENLEIMEFIENSEGDAIRIFQTVNDRGKPLSIMEKIKSLLVYFSNKYLNKKYDDEINHVFGEIFEFYDSIKDNGDKLGITLIKRQDFNEDNILCYHYVTYFSDNYEPTADFVLKSIKQRLTDIRNLEMDDRFTICNMAIEAGAKNGIFPVDDRTVEYLNGRVSREWMAFEADPDAEYAREVTIDLSALRPTVSFPHLPSNTKSVDEAAGKPIQQVVIGSCTNGRLKDLREAAAILKGRKVADGVRCIVIPATQQIYLDAMAEGLVADFIQAGAVVSTPTCGPCLGGHMGVLSDNEWAISTTNRNFVGRMGPTSSMIILASPAVAAASAVTGVVTDPATL